MANYQSLLMKTLTERGYLYQCTDEAALDSAALEGVTGYIGFDCTAPSLHVGSLVQIMMLRQQVFAKFLDFDGPNAAIIVDNADWLDALGYIEFLREVGPHFTINRMVTMETAKRRLENELPMTFLEFNYPLLQSYDFVELNRRHNCTLQLGGSDQWGNIVTGVDLTRRMEGKDCYGFTTPSSGRISIWLKYASPMKQRRYYMVKPPQMPPRRPREKPLSAAGRRRDYPHSKRRSQSCPNFRF